MCIYIKSTLLTLLFANLNYILAESNALRRISKLHKIKHYSCNVLTKYYGENLTSVQWLEELVVLESEHGQLLNVLNDTELKIGIFNDRNFDCRYKIFPNFEHEYKGYSLDVINELQRKLKFRVKIIPLEYEFQRYDGSLLQNIDILLCHPGMNKKFNDLSQLYPTLQSCYVVINKMNQGIKSRDIFIVTFVGTLWLSFAVLLLLLAISLKICTKRYSLLYQNHESWSWVEITLWAIATICQQGLNYSPSGFASKLIFVLGYLLAFLSFTCFAASITSVLFSNKLKGTIRLKDIYSDDLNVVAFGQRNVLENYFHNLSEFRIVSRMKDLFREMEIDDTVVGIAPKIYFEQYLYKYLNRRGKVSFEYMEIPIQQFSSGFIVPTNFKFKSIFNRWILYLVETGILEATLERNTQLATVQEHRPTYSSVALHHVRSGVLILLVGIIAATTFLLIETTFYYYKKRCSKRKVNGKRSILF